MTDEKAKGKRGRPKGSPNKDKNLSLSDLWDSLSVKEKKKTFMAATPNQKLQLVSALEKRSQVSEAERVSVTFNSYLNGPTTCPGCGATIPVQEQDPEKRVASPVSAAPSPSLRDTRDKLPRHGEPCPDIPRLITEEREKIQAEREKEMEHQELRELNKALADRGLPIWDNLEFARGAAKGAGIFLNFAPFKID